MSGVRVPLTKYQGNRAALATAAGAVARPLCAGLGLEVVALPELDIGVTGTFADEGGRGLKPEVAALERAHWGMAVTGLALGLASEGRFGPHPQLGFVPAHHELLVFVDAELEFYAAEQTTTTMTNFAHTEVARVAELTTFLVQACFPSHALVVQPNLGGVAGDVEGGVQSYGQLAAAVRRARALSWDGLARVETDMRAAHNPSRRRTLRRLASALVRRLRVVCPRCLAPGWGFVTVEPGLPCRECGTPTYVARHELFGCPRCGYRQEVPRRDGLLEADPRHCAFCRV